MRILQALGWYLPDSLGGTEVYVAALAERLTAAGHEVLVAAPEAGLAAPRTYRHQGVEVFRYPVPAMPTRHEARGVHAVGGAAAFHEWMARLAPDIVHIHTFVTGLGLLEVKAARRVARRVVVTTHSSALGFLCGRGTLLRWGSEPCDGLATPAKCAPCRLQARGTWRPAAQALSVVPETLATLALGLPGRLGTALGMKAIVRDDLRRQAELLHEVDRFVVLTQWALDAIVANGFPRERLVLNRLGTALAPVRSPREARSGPLRLGYLGRYDPVKGVEDLVRAAVAQPEALAFSLEIRGPLRNAADRAQRARLEALAGNDPRVRFGSEVESHAVAGVLAGYDVLCCPSRCHEGGPTVALEAQAVGTPVLGTHIGGLAEIVRDGIDGRLVPVGDLDALTRALGALAADPGVLEAWRRALPQPRSMDDVTADYLALYASEAPR